jgi:RecA-family ATPase
MIFGNSGVGKSFLALDWSLSIATGLPWAGRSTAQGSVVYMAAEGVSGYAKRIDSWLTAKQLDEKALDDRLLLIPAAVQLMENAEVSELLLRLSSVDPAPSLVVIDTLARCLVGADENIPGAGPHGAGAPRLSR